MTRLKRPPSIEDTGTMFCNRCELRRRRVPARYAYRRLPGRDSDLRRRASPRGLAPLSSNPCVQVVRKIAGWVPSSKLRMLIAATVVRAPLILRKRRKSANN
jgi:hypothetical protein